MNIRPLAASILLSATFSVPANAGTPAITKGGYVACLTKEWLDDFVDYSSGDDRASAKAYLESQKCIVLKAGLRVTVMESTFSRRQFAFQGYKFWTVAEALQNLGT